MASKLQTLSRTNERKEREANKIITTPMFLADGKLTVILFRSLQGLNGRVNTWRTLQSGVQRILLWGAAADYATATYSSIFTRGLQRIIESCCSCCSIHVTTARPSQRSTSWHVISIQNRVLPRPANRRLETLETAASPDRKDVLTEWLMERRKRVSHR